MKKTILAITLALLMLPMVFAEGDGSLYVGIDPKLQLPSYDLSKGEQITGLGFGIGLDVGYQTSELWSAGFRVAFEYYFPYGENEEDKKDAFMIPFGVRFAKELPITETFSFIPFLGTGALVNITESEFRPYIETGIQLQFYYDEKWNFFVGYDANFSFNNEAILTHGVSLGFRFYPLREKTPLDVAVTQDGDRIKIDVPAIIFDPNLNTFDEQPIAIKRQNKKVLDTVAKLLKEYKEYNVSIEAYANAVLGTEDEIPVLLKLSQGRAETVKTELIKRGISEARLTAVGKGARNSSDAASNRRAEFILEK